MNNRLYDFDKTFTNFTGQGYVPWVDKQGKHHKGWFGDDIHYFSINPDVIKLLEKTDIPKKPLYLKLPYDHIFISNQFSFGDIVLPHGFFICMNDDLLIEDNNTSWKDFDKYCVKCLNREKIKDNEYPDGMVEYKVGFNYLSDKGQGYIEFMFYDMIFPDKSVICEIQHYNKGTYEMDGEEFAEYDSKVYEDAGYTKYFDQIYKEFPIQEIAEFIYKLLLFIDCPDVELKQTEGRAKHFRKKGYDFFEPKKLYSELSHDLRKYIYEIKRHHGVKFSYHYKYMVRGHFRTMMAHKYKNHNTIWIKPYFKGNGKYIPKEKIVCRNI